MHALLRAPAPQHDRGDQLAGDGRRTATAAAVLRTILDHGPVARSTVARLTGLSAAAVSRQSTELAELGLIRERPVRRPRPAIGRPHVPVDIDTRSHLAGGIHIALRHTTLVLMDLRGRVLAEQRTPHRDRTAEAVLADAGDRMAAFLDEHTCGRRPLGIGLASGGWIDPVRGVVVRHTQLDWRDVPAQAVLEARLGLPVRVESHSRALARAEQLIGAHRTRARMSLVHLFVGNVVDAAIVTGGTVHHGPRSAAGDVSHLPVGSGSTLPGRRCPCGRTGCFQATVAEQALAEHATTTGLLPEARFPDVLAALEADEPWAVALFRERARLVGRAVALLLDVINPEILVVAEAGITRRPELLDELHAEVAERAHVAADPRRTVVASSFGRRTLGVAAGSIVLYEAYARPLELGPPPART
jgi:predicted NBD/HSP70 family sugar kinase